MRLKNVLSIVTASVTSVALFSGVSLTAVAGEASLDNKVSHLERAVDAAQDSMGIEYYADEIVPEHLDSMLSYESGRGITSLTLDSSGVNVDPFSGDSTKPLFTINDGFPDGSFSVTQDGSAVLPGESADYVIDAYNDGSLRVQAVIESQEDNHALSFGINLAEDELARIEPDGSVGFYRVSDDGAELLTSVIDKPWAVDGSGKSVETSFELDGNKLIQTIKPDATTVYPVTADPFWIPALVAGIRVGVHVLIKVGPRVVKYAAAPASRVVNALKNFSALTFRAGSNVVRLDKSAMKHILQRHHPQYWNGTKKGTQTFFNPEMSVSDVRATINGALRQHASSLRKLGSKTGTYTVTYNVIKYKLVVSKGRVVQFYPR
ncbi:hypothetical protein ACTOVN_07955 [Arcanobacterium canis]